MWKRGVRAAHMDLTAYVNKFHKKTVCDFLNSPDLETSKKAWGRIRRALQNKPAHLGSMLVFSVHQACGNDQLKEAEKLLDAVEDEAFLRLVVNAPYGRQGYTPLHRAAFQGSCNMLRFLVCRGADINAVSPEGESILEILNQGLTYQEKQCAYSLAEIIHFDQASNFYRVRMPNGTIQEFSSALVDETRKWVPDGHVYVYTPEQKENMMFIREKYRVCETWIRQNKANKHGPSKIPTDFNKRRSCRRWLSKRSAARIIQGWWRDHKL